MNGLECIDCYDDNKKMKQIKNKQKVSENAREQERSDKQAQRGKRNEQICQRTNVWREGAGHLC